MLLLLAGCGCGDVVVSNTTADNFEGNQYNGSWKEKCGPINGAYGNWDLFGEGTADMWFSPSARGDRFWMASDLEITLSMDLGSLVVGEVLGLDEVWGGASINPGVSLSEDPAGLTEARVEVLDGPDPDEDVCLIEDGPVYRLSWELLYGGGDGPTYELSGRDKVRFSTFLSESCPQDW